MWTKLAERLADHPGVVALEFGGEGACYTLDMPRGELRIIAPVGVNVTLDFAL